jgi:hypothetical protein
MVCPSCRRPVAVARATCLYCGAALPADATRAVRAADVERNEPRSDRALIILDLDRVDPAQLSRSLGVSAFEAGQRARRGGFDLWRIAPATEAARERDRLAAAGITAFDLPEDDVRAAANPVVATGGRFEGGALHLRHVEGRLRLEGSDVLLVLRGPIAREYAVSPEAKRPRIAAPDGGYRIHVHRSSDTRPLELDPGDFDFGQAVLGRSSLLTLQGWVEGLAPGAPTDDRFRVFTPALAPARGDALGPVAAVTAFSTSRGTPGRREDPYTVLDNLEQFRFYSAWRGSLERRRSSS